MFEFNGELFRAVNASYQQDFDHLFSSGLYDELINRGMMVPFEEVDPLSMGISGLYKVLKPERIKFISYPYEWAFSMLRDAAILTLEIQKLALEHGMSLKDASAFNVQFQNGQPVFIDTLSFELNHVNRPWVAYRQFCQHFLAPLALMANVDPRLNRMFIIHLDGIPLNLAVKLLPIQCWFSMGLLLNIYLHAKSLKKYEAKTISNSLDQRKFSLRSMHILIEGLKSAVEAQQWRQGQTEWANYTEEGVHQNQYIEFKSSLISRWLDEVKPQTVWDLGANIGDYSRIAAQKGIDVVSFDFDPDCVNNNYALVRKRKESNIPPLFLDILNPSPAIGWGGFERISFYDRTKPDMIMALALIHHLAISANIPLELIAAQLGRLTNTLIIEFVPKDDEKVRQLLLNRDDIFPNYTQERFEFYFSNYFRIERLIQSKCNSRVFYLMTQHEK
jgi:hypothetical protein